MENRTAEGDRWLHRFSLFTAASTLFLIFAGGLVTSTGSGLAVPDWPLSYGMLFPPMVGGIFYEHGHRMIASVVGLLTVILAIWIWKSERRRWLRYLGFGALAAVILQGILGGITVLYLLPTPISVTHACLAQTFFCITVSIVMFTSPGWQKPVAAIPGAAGQSLRRLAVATTAIIYLQLILGAVMRHTNSGLAIPDFPLSFGNLIPPFSALTVDSTAPFPLPLATYKMRVFIHFLHRAWALVVSVVVICLCSRILVRHQDLKKLVNPALLLLGLLITQVTLGALVVWTEKGVSVTTFHVAVGASTLATSLVLTIRAWRMSISESTRSQPIGKLAGEQVI
jgi:cytochrome c oxidase assembly protein subunit 15